MLSEIILLSYNFSGIDIPGDSHADIEYAVDTFLFGEDTDKMLSSDDTKEQRKRVWDVVISLQM